MAINMISAIYDAINREVFTRTTNGAVLLSVNDDCSIHFASVDEFRAFADWLSVEASRLLPTCEACGEKHEPLPARA